MRLALSGGTHQSRHLCLSLSYHQLMMETDPVFKTVDFLTNYRDVGQCQRQ
jgi:hypothetical protein